MKKENKQKINQPIIDPETLLVLVEIGKLLTSSLDLDEILQLIISRASRLIPAENWSLLLKNQETGELTFAVVEGSKKESLRGFCLPPGQGIAGCVAQSGHPEFVADVQSDTRFYREMDARSGFTTRSVVCLPLKIHGKTLGVMEIVNVEDIEVFKERDLPVLQALADYAAIAIENSRYVSTVRRLSIIDEYTGLYNVRHLYRVLEDIIGSAREKGFSVAVVFADIDNFKELVDEHGHLLGSRALKEIGSTILGCLDRSDMVFKYGGDEYVLVLPGRSRTAARELVETVRSTIASSTYLQTEGKPVRVTASFGLAMFPEDGETAKELLLAADHLMYRVKNTTKNGLALSDGKTGD
ncbi:MAG: sensor domain-containing diguanylate cyclase [PVC group bacterium]